MSGVTPNGHRYRFGPFELNTSEESLSRNGTRLKVQDLPYRLLVILVERPGEIVTREQVRERLWPENTFVEFDNSLGVAIRKIRDALRDNADAPCYVETVPRRGYRFLAPVEVLPSAEGTEVRRKPESGFDGSVTEQPPGAVPGIGLPERRVWIVVTLVLLVTGAAMYFFRSLRPHTADGARGVVSTVHVRRSVAVLGFRNLPGRPEDKWLSPAFCEMLNTDLAAGGELRLVSGEDVARAKSDLPLADEDTLAKSTLQRLRVDPGADVVVLGSYTVLATQGTKHIRLDVRVQDTARGETIAEQSFTGNEENLFELATQAGQALRQSLGIGSASTQASLQASAALPSNQDAIRFYTAGRERLWAFDYMHARDLLLQAVAADPTYPLAHSALSEVWDRLDYSAKAKAEAERALQLSGHLSQEERLLVEGQYRTVIEDRPKAVAAYQALFDLFPDNLEYGLRLASAQRWVKPADSLRTLDILRHLPAPAGEDPRIDRSEASAWINQDFEKGHAAAERAIAKGTAQGSRLLVAHVYGILCQQGANGGASITDAMAACENSRQWSAAAGDRNGEARTMNDFAGLYFFQGDLAQAEAMWREAIPKFREIGDRQGVAAATNNLGDVLLMRGRLGEAKKFLQQAIPNYQAVEDKDGLARVLNDLGDLSRQKGDLEAALTSYREARATGEEIDDKSAIAYVLTGMGDVYLDRGDLVAARRAYEESLTLRKQTGEKQTVAETELALARVSLEQGHAADAESVIRKCKEQFQQDHEADDELSASTVLIDALVAEGKYADAAREVDAEKPLAAKSVNELFRLRLDLASARLELVTNHRESSRTGLTSTLQRAHARGLLGTEFEARLSLAELEERSGQRSAGEADLLALEAAARAKGFGLIVGKALSIRHSGKKQVL
jgi:DNA-binding winged helix-turn-helix (wHTH) protein/tetratricopeptide (TPR) repeat protein